MPRTPHPHSRSTSLRPWARALTALALQLLVAAGAVHASPELPELVELEWILDAEGDALGGIVFDIREHDPEALNWVLPRLATYLRIIRQTRPGLPVALVAHGEEIALLTRRAAGTHRELHAELRRLREAGLTIHVCAGFARQIGLDESDFPAYVDVVPYGPAQVQDYKEMGYGHLTLELTW
jgi:intracellular sulfur oxidation DsrE/DsrF family protein